MKLVFLGTGAGQGIPTMGCECKTCIDARQGSVKDNRQRSCIFVESQEHNILIDAPPEVRLMLNRENIQSLTAILLTHEHYDHISGIAEFEYWKKTIHIFTYSLTYNAINLSDKLDQNHLISLFHSQERIYFGALEIIPFEVHHKVKTHGFLLCEAGKKAAIFSDSTNKLSRFHHSIIASSDLCVFNTTRYDSGKDHITIKEVMEIAKKHPTTRFVITHINHENFCHEEIEKLVARTGNIDIAYDTMTVTV